MIVWVVEDFVGIREDGWSLNGCIGVSEWME